MATETILYVILAGVISIALAVFMYGYKSKQKGSLRWVFGILRFITLFSILLLIINPKFKSETYTIEKPKLPVLVDNSASIAELEQSENVSELLQKLKENDAINEKFDVSYFSFGNDFRESDSLSFDEKNTNISKALASANELFKNQTAPTIVITDGNQTLGNDYEFSSAKYINPIYPVILGDSIKYTDLKIEQLNTNRYAFLKNQFPVEVIVTYSGANSVSSEFVVTQGATKVYRTNISFSENETSKSLNFTLNASSVGLQKYTVQLLPLADEKNKTNNSKQFAVEVIDQATNVLVVSKLSHPDLGALKKAISSNEQRTISFKKPAEAIGFLNDFQLVILYQPDRSFASVFAEIEKLNKNTWVISGLQTDWYFLNGAQDNFNKEASNQSDDVQAALNSNYDFDEAFKTIYKLKTEDPLEYRYNYARDSLVHALRDMANKKFNTQDFSQAVGYYLILKKYEDPESFETIRQISLCQYYLGNYTEALHALKQLHNLRPYNLELVYRIGMLNLEKLDNPEEALYYFSYGKRIFKENLTEIYGAAFEVVMNPVDAPDIYFDLFQGRALANLQLKYYEEAVTDCNWAVFLRRERSHPYVLRATANAALNNLDNLCSDLAKAKKLGATDTEILSKKYCR